MRVPLFFIQATVGRLFAGKAKEDADGEELIGEDESDGAQNTPGSDSAGEDFEVISKSTESLSKAKTSGAQQGSKPNKRKNKKK